MAEYENILVEMEDDVFYLTLDREHRMNSMNEDLLNDVRDGIQEAEDEGARCIVIQGAGENFSAGADVSSFSPSVQALYKSSKKGKKVIKAIEETPIPVVAAIRGNCLGGGLEMSLACDFRIAAEDAKLGQPELNLGIIPGWGGTQRLPQIVGLAKAKELIMLAKRIPADEALEIGLVNKVVTVDEFEDEVEEFASEIASGPPIALKYAKFAMNYGTQVPTDVGEEIESSLFGSLASTEDMMEGIEAFMEKREPEFEGE